MANPEKGEVDVEIGGQTYTLVSTFNALIQLQKLFSGAGALVPVEDILRRANDGDLEAFRALFWSMLRRYHAAVTLDQAGDLIDAAGGIVALNAKLVGVQEAGDPDPRDVEALRPANPPKAARPKGRRRPTGETSPLPPAG